ncbi:unnamed protein product, partial [Oppiella nova]
MGKSVNWTLSWDSDIPVLTDCFTQTLSEFEVLESDSESNCPMKDFNIFSKIFVVWIKNILKHGYKSYNDLSQHLLPICNYLKAKNSYQTVQAALISAIYQKMLRLSAASRREYTTGDINNIMGVDVTEICDFFRSMTSLYAVPLSLMIGGYILWRQLGPSSLTLFVMMAIVGPLNTLIMRKINGLQTKQMELKDKRMEQISEVLNNIKLLKLFGWEKPFMDRVSKTRHQELHTLRIANYWWSSIDVLWVVIPFMIAGITFT